MSSVILFWKDWRPALRAAAISVSLVWNLLNGRLSDWRCERAEPCVPAPTIPPSPLIFSFNLPHFSLFSCCCSSCVWLAARLFENPANCDLAPTSSLTTRHVAKICWGSKKKKEKGTNFELELQKENIQISSRVCFSIIWRGLDRFLTGGRFQRSPLVKSDRHLKVLGEEKKSTMEKPSSLFTTIPLEMMSGIFTVHLMALHSEVTGSSRRSAGSRKREDDKKNRKLHLQVKT